MKEDRYRAERLSSHRGRAMAGHENMDRLKNDIEEELRDFRDSDEKVILFKVEKIEAKEV